MKKQLISILLTGILGVSFFAQSTAVSAENESVINNGNASSDVVSLENELAKLAETVKGMPDEVASTFIADTTFELLFNGNSQGIYNLLNYGTTDAEGPFGQNKLDGVEWFRNAAKEDRYITGYENGQPITLHGYYIANGQSQKTAIVQHGFRALPPAEVVAGYAKMLYDRGFNVLIPELRAQGQSEGTYITFGVREKDDMLGWIQSIPSEQEVVLFGESMGAATVLMTAGSPMLPANVKAVISDCGPSSLDGMVESIVGKINEQFDGLISPTVMVKLDEVFKERVGFSIHDASAINTIGQANVPILFIHGTNDNFVPYYMAEQLYQGKVSGYRDLLTVAGADHTQSFNFAYPTYLEKVDQLLGDFVTK